MSEERDKILKLLEEKRITADEAARLLDAVNEAAPNGRNRFIKVRVTDKDSGKARVNVTLPISLVKWGMKFAPDSAKAQIAEHDIDLRLISEALEKGITGKIVEVDEEEKGEHVEVWLE
jgi:hypothetical protein